MKANQFTARMTADAPTTCRENLNLHVMRDEITSRYVALLNDPMSPFPDLTHLQFVVLDCIGSRSISGRELRDLLAEKGVRKSGPAFYQMMSRMEESKFVLGEYIQKVIDGQTLRERVYTVLGPGARAYDATVRFYRRHTGGGVLIPEEAKG